MGRRKILDWAEVRQRYEAGETVSMLAQKMNVKADEIRRRAHAENWGANAGEEKLRAEQKRRQELVAARAAAAGALATLPADQREALLGELLRRYLQGETPEKLRAEVGASRATFYYALLGGADERIHGDLVTQSLAARIARADDMLETAADSLELKRAGDLARLYRQDLERRRPAIYGQQRRLEVVPGVDLGERLRESRQREAADRLARARERVVDAEIVAPAMIESKPGENK